MKGNALSRAATLTPWLGRVLASTYPAGFVLDERTCVEVNGTAFIREMVERKEGIVG